MTEFNEGWKSKVITPEQTLMARLDDLEKRVLDRIATLEAENLWLRARLEQTKTVACPTWADPEDPPKDPKP